MRKSKNALPRASRSAGPGSPKPPTGNSGSLSRKEQSDKLAKLMLESAQRLATDPQRLAQIKKLLF
jgi:hypothetical protein